MIYSNTYFKEELKKSFIYGKGSGWKLLVVTVCIALLSILLNSCVSVVESTVIGDYLSLFGGRTFFGIISSMNLIILFFFVAYLIQNYELCTFAEINRNRWYMLKKTGYKTGSIVLSKQVSTLLMASVIYACSFVFLTFFCIIFRYSILISTLVSLAISGFIKVLFITEVIITFSFFARKKSAGRIIGWITLILMIVLENITGFYSFISLPINMQATNKLFVGSRSIFTYSMIFGYVVLFAISSFIASKKANYYSILETGGSDIFIVDYKTNKTVSSKKFETNTTRKAVKIVVAVGLCLIMLLVVVANVLIISMGSMDRKQVFSVKGYVPMLFSSETMTGKIEKNDFAVFKDMPADYKYQVGDVVLYFDSQGNAKVKEIKYYTSSGNYVADVISYPEGSDYGSEREETDGKKFESVLIYTNRWLGAWLVWNNSTFGRIVSICVPILIIVFYDKFALVFKKIKETFSTEEK